MTNKHNPAAKILGVGRIWRAGMLVARTPGEGFLVAWGFKQATDIRFAPALHHPLCGRVSPGLLIALWSSGEITALQRVWFDLPGRAQGPDGSLLMVRAEIIRLGPDEPVRLAAIAKPVLPLGPIKESRAKNRAALLLAALGRGDVARVAA